MSVNLTLIGDTIYETVGDQRFYPYEGGWLPSVTTILGAVYPKSQFLIDWQIENGKEESERIRDEAAEEGRKIHSYIEDLTKGLVIPAEAVTPKARRCIKAFLTWYDEYKPEIISVEQQVYNVDKGYAGTIDMVARVNGEVTVVDFKTSNAVHESYRVQVAAYVQAYNMTATEPATKAFILHLNSKNKQGYGYNEVKVIDNQIIWNSCLNMFKTLFPDAAPNIKEYPLEFKLNKKC